MPRLKPTEWRVQVRVFGADGFTTERQSGSRIVMSKPGVARPVIVPSLHPPPCPARVCLGIGASPFAQPRRAARMVRDYGSWAADAPIGWASSRTPQGGDVSRRARVARAAGNGGFGPRAFVIR